MYGTSSSILETVKKHLIGNEEDDGFDTDIIDAINSRFLELHQLGVGPKEGFSIEGPSETWDDYIQGDKFLLSSVKEYIWLKVKKTFDPSASPTVAAAYDDRIAELTFRINAQAEGGASDS